MIDAYSIGTTLKLHDLVSPQLLKLSEQFEKVDVLATQLNKNLKIMGAEVVGIKNLSVAAAKLDLGLKGVGDQAMVAEKRLRGISGAIPTGGIGLERELSRANIEADLLEKKLAAMRALGRVPGGGGGGGGGIPPILPAPGGGGRGGRHGGRLHGGNMHVGPHGFGIGGVGMGLAGDMLVPLAAAGIAVYAGSGAVKEASEYQREQAQFSMFGMNAAQNAEAKRFAEQTKMPGASMIDKMRYMIEAQGVFRESGMKGNEALGGAKLVAPILAKLHYASLLSGHEMGETEEKAMLRFVETRGGLKDPKELAKIADLGFKVNMTSGGNVDWEQMRSAMMTGGIAAKSLNDEALFAWGEPLMGELKGGGFGTGLRTAFNRMNGIIKLPNQAYHEMEKLDLWDRKMVVENSNGGIKSFKGNPLRHADEYAENPFKYYVDYIMPKYDKLGLSESQRNTENAILFGGTGARLFSTLEQQLSTILNSLPAIKQAKGLDPAVKATDETTTGQMKEFGAAWSDFKNTFGQTMLPAVTKILQEGTDILKTITSADKNMKDEQDYVNQGTGFLDRLKRQWEWHPGMGAGINPVADPGHPSAPMHGTVNLDGHKVGTFMADHLGRQASNPLTGTTSFDMSMGLPTPGLNYQR